MVWDSSEDGDPRRRRWVLVVDGGIGQNRSALAAVQALAAAGFRPAVTVSAPHSLPASSRYCERLVSVPLAGQPGFREAVAEELARGEYLAVLPTTDAAVLELRSPGHHLVDKTLLAEHAGQAGLVVPRSLSFPDKAQLLASASGLPYPVVVKPTLKTRRVQQPAHRVDDPEELATSVRDPGPYLVQPFIDEQVHAVAGVMWGGEIVAGLHQVHRRLWPPVCGDACAAVTAARDSEVEQRLCRLLADFRGVFQAEFAGSFLLDVNPRVYGSLQLATAAGLNLVGAYCDLLRGEPVGAASAPEGVGYRWLEGDTRHLLWSLRQRRPVRWEQFARIGSYSVSGSPASLDIGPVISRLAFAANRR